MLFSSPIFLFLFLPLVILGYFLSPKILKNLFLILTSCFFYAWGEGKYLLYILTIIIANYLFGLFLTGKNKKIFLVLAIIFNLSLLLYFKYFLFIFHTLTNLLPTLLPPITLPQTIHMPLGVSFVTFHALSYLIDVYQGKIRPEKNPWHVGLYFLLFPHLIAGPIVRYIDIRSQIKNRHVNFKLFFDGAERFVFGLAKKVIIANNVGILADRVFNLFPHQVSAPILWLGLLAYTLQIYFDFSGYSDMAIGLAKMFGFRFKENFNFPYLASSVQDFWRRWHMTLSSWFRDYLYIPLGGNRRGKVRVAINILVVFFLTGLWHGASWNFVFWGVYYGVFLVIERVIFKDSFEKIWRPLRHFYTLIVVIIGWLFFRIQSLSYAFYLLKIMFGIEKSYSFLPVEMFVNRETLLILVLGIILSTSLVNQLKRIKYINLAFGLIILIYSAMELISGTYNPFIYFRF
jgi:alginate O-acetyltransferase complex protein AlgI